jgi:hypothetical protein
MIRPLASLVAAAALVAASPARAEDETPPQGSEKRAMDPAAERELERGEQLVEAGDYSSAIASYEAGFAIDPHPLFLYFKGQAQRLNGDCAGAIQSYQGFLATSPSKKYLKAIRYNITRCEAELAAGRGRDAPPPPRYRPRWKDPIGGVLAGGALVGVAAGATLLVMADRNVDNANDAYFIEDYWWQAELADSRRRNAGYAFIAGGVLALGATLRYVLHDPPEIQITGAVTGRGATFAIGGTF